MGILSHVLTDRCVLPEEYAEMATGASPAALRIWLMAGEQHVRARARAHTHTHTHKHMNGTC